MRTRFQSAGWICFILFALSLIPTAAFAQCAPNCTVTNTTQLDNALRVAVSGDVITLANDITLTANVSAISTAVTIDGGGHTLSGANTYRGLYFGYTGSVGSSFTATVQNLTIANTVANGGNGGSGTAGGGGGAGLGGALFIDNSATVNVNNVNLNSTSATGGNGGTGSGVNGGNGGGGGGLATSGGNAVSGGGGNGGDGGSFLTGGSGTGGTLPSSPGGSSGSFGGGGGGSIINGSGVSAGAGGFGAGGGGGDIIGGAAGFGGGGGGTGPNYFGTASAGLFGGAGGSGVGSNSNGGGGAALGGAVFVATSGGINIQGAFSINGSSVSAGAAGGTGAGAGTAAGSGIFFAGGGTLFVSPTGTQSVTIAGSIADQVGTLGSGSSASVTLSGGANTVVTLSGNNTYSGGTSINSGTLNVSSNSNLGNGGSVSLYAGTLGLTGTSTFTHQLLLNGSSSVSVSAGQNASWSGAISELSSGSTLGVSGGGTLTLANSTNSFSGGVRVTGGSTVAVDADSELGATSGGLTLGDSSSAGTLSINAANFTSSRTFTLGSGGATIDTVGGTNATLNGTVQGSGGLTKAGSGTLILSGTIGYGGGTTILGGTLRAGNANLFGGLSALSIGAGSTIDFAGFSQSIETLTGAGNVALGGGALTIGGGGSSSTFNGVIGGSGGLVKNGGGTLTLLGANTYTGGTRINGGNLVANSGSLFGNVVDNAGLVFDQSFNGTFAGAISGTGAFGKSSGGALTLSGANTYTGGTLVTGGSLIGTTSSLQGAIIDNATVQIAQNTDATFNGTLSGNGLFSKAGTGTLTINGSHPFTGVTSVDAGGLVLNGSLGGGVNVGAGSSLIAAGSIGGNLNVASGASVLDSALVGGNLTLASGATMFAAGSVGGSATISGNLTVPTLAGQLAAFGVGRFKTLATSSTTTAAPQLVVNGDFSALAGSQLSLTVSPTGIAPILVSGKAILQGTQFNITVNDPTPSRANTYVALAALKGLTASSVVANVLNSQIVPVTTASPNSLLVTLINYNIPLASVATGANAVSVGRAVDILRNGATGDAGLFTRELGVLSDADLTKALNSLSGEIHASEARMLTTDGQQITDLIRDTVSDREDARKENGPGRSKLSPMWVELAGDHGTFSDGTTSNTGGGAGGYDIKSTDNFTVGAGVSFTQGSLTLGDGGGTSNMTAPRAFGYSGVSLPGSFGIHLGGSAAHTSNDTTRQVAFQATVPDGTGQFVPLDSGINRTATSTDTGTAADGWTELKNTQKRGQWQFDFRSSVRAFKIARAAFTESGADAISLQGGDDSITVKEADVNVNSQKKSGKWRPRFQMEYRRTFAPDDTTANLNFNGDPAANFQTQGLPIPKNEYQGIAGITMRGNFLEYTIEYHFAKLQGETHNSLSFRMHFK
ncbi:MAG TPA: autotransporter-associated beta strand repeat-containing protein [Vicinamibacterales bacterium]|jgi:autotransporter-associated beta strand protein|nr:autotransporter-associated beta strand repeat-containing protein [Vicinamibacterales bacterium]